MTILVPAGHSKEVPGLVDEPDYNGSEHLSDGVTPPLNSKKLVISQLHRLATLLQISTVGSETATVYLLGHYGC